MKKVNGPALVKTAIRIAQGEVDKKDVVVAYLGLMRYELQLIVSKDVRIMLAYASTADEIDEVYSALVGHKKLDFPCEYCRARQKTQLSFKF